MTNESEIERLRPLVGKWVITLSMSNNRHKKFFMGFDADNRPVTSYDGTAFNAMVELDNIVDRWQEPKRHKGGFWVNFYADGSVNVYLNRADAEYFSGVRIACIEFPYDFEEGDGL